MDTIPNPLQQNPPLPPGFALVRKGQEVRARPDESTRIRPWPERKIFMNRLKILLLTTALITGSSALASAQETYHAGFAVQVHLGGQAGDGDNYRNGYYGNGDRDRDDRNFNGKHRNDRDGRRDRDDYRWGWGHDRDHDGDRR
jgi:hypothetical protein